jgi:hypothetical protein
MSVTNLITELFKLAETALGKMPNWEQKKRDLYYKKLSRYKKLSVMDRRYVNQEELLKLEDDIAIFVKSYREELEK